MAETQYKFITQFVHREDSERKESFTRLMTAIRMTELGAISDEGGRWQKGIYRVIASNNYKSITVTKKQPKPTEKGETVLPIYRGYNTFGINLDIDLQILWGLGLLNTEGSDVNQS